MARGLFSSPPLLTSAHTRPPSRRGRRCLLVLFVCVLIWCGSATRADDGHPFDLRLGSMAYAEAPDKDPAAAGVTCIHEHVQRGVLEAIAQITGKQSARVVHSLQYASPHSSLVHESSVLNLSDVGLPTVRSSVVPLSMRRNGIRELSSIPGPSAVEPQAVGLNGADPTSWSPLRIRVFADSLTQKGHYCDHNEERIADGLGDIVTCGTADILNKTPRALLLNGIVPSALSLHSSRLSVQRFEGSWTVGSMVGTPCAAAVVPSSHTTQGVRDADLVVYLSAVPTSSGVRAWSAVCQVFPDGRPAVAVLNVAPRYVTTVNLQRQIRVVAHALGHALGFSAAFYMTAGLLHTASGVRGKFDPVPVLNGSALVAATQTLYGCSTLRWMELDDQSNAINTRRASSAVGEEVTAVPAAVSSPQVSTAMHWKMRQAKDELMSGSTSGGFYTMLTLAAFNDLGFYQADMDSAETMLWGANSGCGLFTEKCLTEGVTTDPSMFCSELPQVLHCTSDRRSLGYCDIVAQGPAFPAPFQYFAYVFFGGSERDMDYCPFITPSETLRCDAAADEPGAADLTNIVRNFSVTSETARCVDGFLTPSVPTPLPNYRGVCVDVICNATAGTFQIQLMGSSALITCTPGMFVDAAALSSLFSLGSSLTCPSYTEVCQDNQFVSLESLIGDGCRGAARLLRNSCASAVPLLMLLCVLLSSFYPTLFI